MGQTSVINLLGVFVGKTSQVHSSLYSLLFFPATTQPGKYLA